MLLRNVPLTLLVWTLFMCISKCSIIALVSESSTSVHSGKQKVALFSSIGEMLLPFRTHFLTRLWTNYFWWSGEHKSKSRRERRVSRTKFVEALKEFELRWRGIRYKLTISSVLLNCSFSPCNSQFSLELSLRYCCSRPVFCDVCMYVCFIIFFVFLSLSLSLSLPCYALYAMTFSLVKSVQCTSWFYSFYSLRYTCFTHVTHTKSTFSASLVFFAVSLLHVYLDSQPKPKWKACNRTLFGEPGFKYPLRLTEPLQRFIPFVCDITFSSVGGRVGDIIELTFLSFQVGSLELTK